MIVILALKKLIVFLCTFWGSIAFQCFTTSSYRQHPLNYLSLQIPRVPQLHGGHVPAEPVRVPVCHGLQKEPRRRCLLHPQVYGSPAGSNLWLGYGSPAGADWWLVTVIEMKLIDNLQSARLPRAVGTDQLPGMLRYFCFMYHCCKIEIICRKWSIFARLKGVIENAYFDMALTVKLSNPFRWTLSVAPPRSRLRPPRTSWCSRTRPWASSRSTPSRAHSRWLRVSDFMFLRPTDMSRQRLSDCPVYHSGWPKSDDR